ncbi:hypothetical protein G7054_g6490 [Neopestalotiopsis clavispora]|nr:hypothetical protein G7054_g6490 [Neopestalotiopsis clavispora]
MATSGLRKIAELDSIKIDDFANEEERYAAKEAARQLLRRLETPIEQVFALTLETPSLIASLEICLNLGIWAKWRESIGETHDSARSLDDIIEMGSESIEPDLLRRLLRMIATASFLEEVGVDVWKPTPLTLALGDKSTHLGGMLEWGSHSSLICGANLPQFLKKNGYRNPCDAAKFDNHTDAFGDNFFGLLSSDPVKNRVFMEMMTAWQVQKVDWTQVYDTNRIVDGADLSQPLFVDVGGMHGIDAARLLARHPDLPENTLFVQDQPHVVSSDAHPIDKRITKVPHDFFQPQTILNARAYFFHAVPHDWSDEDNLRIFKNITSAMQKGYSKMLIYEVVLPPTGANAIQSSLDMTVMIVLSASERTEQHWYELLEKAGLKIVSISRRPGVVESVIEAELA